MRPRLDLTTAGVNIGRRDRIVGIVDYLNDLGPSDRRSIERNGGDLSRPVETRRNSVSAKRDIGNTGSRWVTLETDNDRCRSCARVGACRYRVPSVAGRGVGVAAPFRAAPRPRRYLRIMRRNLFKLSVPSGWLALTERPIGNNCLCFR